MNFICIKGRLTKDPELRSTQSGTSVCTISVAVDRGYGEHKTTDFFSCIFWRQGAEFVSKYFAKGQEIIVQGEMQSRQWTDKEGGKHTAWEIGNAHAEFCGSKAESFTAPSAEQQEQNFNGLSDRMAATGDFCETEDDGTLPF